MAKQVVAQGLEHRGRPRRREEKFLFESHKRKFTTATSRETIVDMQKDPGEVVCCI